MARERFGNKASKSWPKLCQSKLNKEI